MKDALEYSRSTRFGGKVRNLGTTGQNLRIHHERVSIKHLPVGNKLPRKIGAPRARGLERRLRDCARPPFAAEREDGSGMQGDPLAQSEPEYEFDQRGTG